LFVFLKIIARNPILLLDPKEPADILSDDNHEKSPVMSVFRKDECAFRCQKSMLPEGDLVRDKKSLSSPITKQAPEVDTKRDAPGDGGDSFVQELRDFIDVTTDADQGSLYR